MPHRHMSKIASSVLIWNFWNEMNYRGTFKTSGDHFNNNSKEGFFRCFSSKMIFWETSVELRPSSSNSIAHYPKVLWNDRVSLFRSFLGNFSTWNWRVGDTSTCVVRWISFCEKLVIGLGRSGGASITRCLSFFLSFRGVFPCFNSKISWPFFGKSKMYVESVLLGDYTCRSKSYIAGFWYLLPISSQLLSGGNWP